MVTLGLGHMSTHLRSKDAQLHIQVNKNQNKTLLRNQNSDCKFCSEGDVVKALKILNNFSKYFTLEIRKYLRAALRVEVVKALKALFTTGAVRLEVAFAGLQK